MKLIAAKFGGSSTATAGRFRQILEIVRASPERRCVVLSAPGATEEGGEKITALLERCRQARAAGRDPAPLIDAVAARYAGIARELGVCFPPGEVSREIEAALEVSDAHTMSRGEALCARLFSRWSGMPMLDAAGLVRFDASGALNVPATLRGFARVRGMPRLIVPGFYGADRQGRIHTLPRNGSDVTGALAAAGIGADVYENWSDVPGLMSADPAIVPDARPIPRVGYRQMRLLAEAGARILHPDALAPVEAAGIPTRLRSTLQPDAPGTVIDGDFSETVPCAAAKDLSESLSQVTVFGLPHDQRGSLESAISPLMSAGERDILRLVVPRARRDQALRAAHGFLP